MSDAGREREKKGIMPPLSRLKMWRCLLGNKREMAERRVTYLKRGFDKKSFNE